MKVRIYKVGEKFEAYWLNELAKEGPCWEKVYWFNHAEVLTLSNSEDEAKFRAALFVEEKRKEIGTLVSETEL